MSWNLTKSHYRSPNLTESYKISPYLTELHEILPYTTESHQISFNLTKTKCQSRNSPGTINIIGGGEVGFYLLQHFTLVVIFPKSFE